MKLSAALVAYAVTACACGPERPPRAASEIFHDRVCHVVLAAYSVGARPAFVEVEVPGPSEHDPPSRVVIAGPNIPMAEQCMGIASRPARAVVESARSAVPAPPPPVEADRTEPGGAEASPDPLSTRR